MSDLTVDVVTFQVPRSINYHRHLAYVGTVAVELAGGTS